MIIVTAMDQSFFIALITIPNTMLVDSDTKLGICWMTESAT